MKSVAPKKSLGQNFLTDRNIARKIISLLNINPGDTIVEIGPGMGALTEFLLEHEIKLHAVELDSEAIDYLSNKYKNNLNEKLILHHQSILDFDLTDVADEQKKIKIIGNIPYNISTEILFKLFDSRLVLSKAVLTVQKEVGKRITAKNGSKVYGITSVATELLTFAKYEFDISAGSFFPAPKVISGVITLEFAKEIENAFYSGFMKMVKVLFNQRRKMISNTIKNIIPKERLDFLRPKLENYLTKRPEQLSLEQFKDLFEIISENNDD